MIDKGYLTAKMKEISEMKGQKITREAIDFLHRYIESKEPEDLDQAVRDILWEEEKFIPVRLKRAMDKYAMARHASVWEEKKIQEKRELSDIAERGGECTRDACRGCPRLEGGCQIRGREWLKGVFWVMGAPKGQGQARAEEINRHMRDKFMGGIQ